MIQYNNQNNITEIHYNGQDIKVAYSNLGKVWEKESPTPTFDGKFKLILNDSSVVTAQCDSTSAITSLDTNRYHNNLVSIEIGLCVNQISDFAFSSCSAMTSVTIPNSVTTIGKQAFYRDSGLTTVTIPDSVTSIGISAFHNCTSLSSVNIPSGITSISENLFTYCISLTSITIPSGVTSIGNSAFSRCSSLTSVTIPDSVTTIGDLAFNNCSSFTSITCLAPTPPTLGNQAFYNTNNCPIYVPASSVTAYQSAWSDYADRIQAIPNS